MQPKSVISDYIILMQSDNKEEETLNKIESIINFKELYYQQRERRIELQRQLELEKIKVKKLTNGRAKTRYCAYCSANISSKKTITKDDGQLIDEFKNFSSKLSFMKFTSSLPYDAQPSLISKVEQFDPSRLRHAGMIQNFAIFGVNQQSIKNFVLQGKQSNQFQGQILYSKKQKNDSEIQASRLVFPSGMVVKRYSNLKAKQKTIQLMSYCYTNLKSFVLSFECPDSNFKEHFHHNDLLHHMNPDHRLFCICIGIHDYTYIDSKKDKFNSSLGVIQNSQKSIISEQEIKIRSQGHQNNFQVKKQSIKSIQDDGADNLNQLEIGITQRVFCIMTYFPFFSFFQDILRNLINIVKMDRLVVYKHNEENIKLTIKQTDSLFQKDTIAKYFQDIMRDLQYKKLSFNKQYELRLINQQKITQMTYWDQAKSFFVREWIYSILSMFTFQSFIDVFTLVMLEDKVVFICENSHILTHTIHLFAHVLMKPLNYSFPVVSIIPGTEQDFLNAPFPVIYGMLKKRKSLEQRRILQHYDNTYVFLSPERVEVYYQEDRKQILSNKSTKLSTNKQLKQLFKDLKKTRKKEVKSVKYELQSSDYCILANADQKQRGVKIVNLISQYINDEIVKKLPSQVEIENLKKKIDLKQLNEQKDEHTYLMGLVVADFKKACKDAFVLQMLNTQMINNFLFTQK